MSDDDGEESQPTGAVNLFWWTEEMALAEVYDMFHVKVAACCRVFLIFLGCEARLYRKLYHEEMFREH